MHVVTKSFVCDNKFDNNSDLKKHKTTEHSKRKKRSTTNPTFPPTPTGFDTTPTGIASQKFKCDKCTMEFETEENLDNHRPSHVFQCEECGLQFERKDKLTSHKKSHILKCEKCKEKFETLVDLESHQIIHKIK